MYIIHPTVQKLMNCLPDLLNRGHFALCQGRNVYIHRQNKVITQTQKHTPSGLANTNIYLCRNLISIYNIIGKSRVVLFVSRRARVCQTNSTMTIICPIV